MNQTNPIQHSIYILDTAAILSRKPFDDRVELMTVSKVSEEFSPGGSSYRWFEYLLEKGLRITDPSKDAVLLVKKTAKEYGEDTRLSETDKDLLALALDVLNEAGKHIVLVTDDYSMQNIADVLNIRFQPVLERGITKRFKWIRRCRGCRRIIHEDIEHCPICGSELSYVRSRTTPLKKKCDR